MLTVIISQNYIHEQTKRRDADSLHMRYKRLPPNQTQLRCSLIVSSLSLPTVCHVWLHIISSSPSQKEMYIFITYHSIYLFILTTVTYGERGFSSSCLVAPLSSWKSRYSNQRLKSRSDGIALCCMPRQ